MAGGIFWCGWDMGFFVLLFFFHEECELFSPFLDLIYTLHGQTSHVPALWCQSPANSQSRQSSTEKVKICPPSCHFILENRWTHFSTKFSKQFAPELRAIFKYFYKTTKREKKFTSSWNDIKIYAQVYEQTLKLLFRLPIMAITLSNENNVLGPSPASSESLVNLRQKG